MLAPRLLLTANSRQSPQLVHALGAGGDADVLERATRGGDARPYEFSFVVLGLPDRQAKGVKDAAGLRSSRENATGVRWLSGTFAAWWQATDGDGVDAETRAGLAAALQQATGLTPFGNPKYIGVPPKWAHIPDGPTHGTVMGDVWGGIVEVSLDRATEDAIVRAGARVLRRGIEPTEASVTAPSGPPAGRQEPSVAAPQVADDLVSCGDLVLPIRRDAITDADQRLLNGYAAAYRRVMHGCSNPALAALLRLPFEISRSIISVDVSALRALFDHDHAPAARSAKQLLAMLGAPAQRSPGVSEAP